MRKTIVIAALMLGAPLAFAQDVSPGLWEIHMETRVPTDSGFKPPAYKLTQCINAETAKDPGMLFSQMGNPGASNCRYSDRNYHGGNTFTFAMRCSGTYAIRSSGKVTFTKETMEGIVNAVANVSDRDVETQNRISARRVGGC